MASLALTALKKTLAPLLALLGVLIWLSNDESSGPGIEGLREACTALVRHHQESGSCPDSLQALRLPTHDGSRALPGLAYTLDGESCSVALTSGQLVGESCTVP